MVGRGSDRDDRRADGRLAAAGRVRAALLGSRARTRADRSAGLRPRCPLLRVGGIGRRLGRTAVRPRHPRHRSDPLPARGTAGAGGGAKPALPRRRRIAGAGRERPRLVRHLGPGLAAGRSRGGQPRAGGRHAALHARRRRRRGTAAARQPGHVPLRRRTQRLLRPAHQELPAEHRGRDDRDLRGRQSRAAGEQHHARWARLHAAHPPFVPARAGGLYAARGRPANRGEHHRLSRLRQAVRTRTPRCNGSPAGGSRNASRRPR